MRYEETAYIVLIVGDTTGCVSENQEKGKLQVVAAERGQRFFVAAKDV
jgi:hypothetical protein